MALRIDTPRSESMDSSVPNAFVRLTLTKTLEFSKGSGKGDVKGFGKGNIKGSGSGSGKGDKGTGKGGNGSSQFFKVFYANEGRDIELKANEVSFVLSREQIQNKGTNPAITKMLHLIQDQMPDVKVFIAIDDLATGLALNIKLFQQVLETSYNLIHRCDDGMTWVGLKGKSKSQSSSAKIGSIVLNPDVIIADHTGKALMGVLCKIMMTDNIDHISVGDLEDAGINAEFIVQVIENSGSFSLNEEKTQIRMKKIEHTKNQQFGAYNTDVKVGSLLNNPAKGLHGLFMKIFNDKDNMADGYEIPICVLEEIGISRDVVIDNLNKPFFYSEGNDSIYMDDGSHKVEFQGELFWFHEGQTPLSLGGAIFKMLKIAQKNSKDGQPFVPFKVITDAVCFIDDEMIQDAIDTHEGTLTYQKWKGELWASFVGWQANGYSKK